MVEKIIERCLMEGSFLGHDEGVIYRLGSEQNIYCINAQINDPIGLHSRAATTLAKKSKDWNMDAYIIDLDMRTMSKTSSVLGVLMMVLQPGRHVAIAANHDATEDKLKQLYDVVTGVYM